MCLTLPLAFIYVSPYSRPSNIKFLFEHKSKMHNNHFKNKMIGRLFKKKPLLHIYIDCIVLLLWRDKSTISLISNTSVLHEQFRRMHET